MISQAHGGCLGEQTVSRVEIPLGLKSLNDGLGAMAFSRKLLVGWRPSGVCCMQMVPPVPMIRTRDSGYLVSASVWMRPKLLLLRLPWRLRLATLGLTTLPLLTLPLLKPPLLNPPLRMLLLLNPPLLNPPLLKLPWTLP